MLVIISSKLDYCNSLLYNLYYIAGIARGQQVNSRRGERMSTFDSFVRPKLGRRNLDVLENAHVTRVSIQEPCFKLEQLRKLRRQQHI